MTAELLVCFWGKKNYEYIHADAVHDLQMWRVAANTLKNLSRTSDKEKSSIVGIERGLTTSCLQSNNVIGNVLHNSHLIKASGTHIIRPMLTYSLPQVSTLRFARFYFCTVFIFRNILYLKWHLFIPNANSFVRWALYWKFD
jgi:hypothetical protein